MARRSTTSIAIRMTASGLGGRGWGVGVGCGGLGEVVGVGMRVRRGRKGYGGGKGRSAVGGEAALWSKRSTGSGRAAHQAGSWGGAGRPSAVWGSAARERERVGRRRGGRLLPSTWKMLDASHTAARRRFAGLTAQHTAAHRLYMRAPRAQRPPHAAPHARARTHLSACTWGWPPGRRGCSRGTTRWARCRRSRTAGGACGSRVVCGCDRGSERMAGRPTDSAQEGMAG